MMQSIVCYERSHNTGKHFHNLVRFNLTHWFYTASKSDDVFFLLVHLEIKLFTSYEDEITTGFAKSLQG